MGENSAISWTTHTFNGWYGCTAVSPGCANCYAEELMANRYHKVEWGAGKARVRTSPANWGLPLKWERHAAETGTRARVFSASLGDVFDAEVPDEWRADLFALIRRTPHLDWLLLTKRPNLIRRSLPSDWGNGYPNVWLGTSVESQAYAWRIAHLVKVPAVVRFLSVEPLLGPLDLSECVHRMKLVLHDPLLCEVQPHWVPQYAPISWVIVGGESGPNFRPMDLDWARDLRDQCVVAGVAFFYKQGSGRRAGQDAALDGQAWHEFPRTATEATA